MLHQKSLVGNSRAGAAQWAEVNLLRHNANLQEAMFANQRGMFINAEGIQVSQGIIPQDVYQAFDAQAVTRFRSDEGDVFMNDLLALSQPINIGKLIQKYRQVSDAGRTTTSMTGQLGVTMDQTEFTFDGTLIPMNETGFGRNWREWNAQTSEGFDALIDDQRESVDSHKEHIVDSFLDGHKDKKGKIIVLDSLSWQGMRNDSRVSSIDLGGGGLNIDFTDPALTYTQLEAGLKAYVNITWIDNDCGKEITIYVSREIASNFDRNSSESYMSQKILDRLAGLQGVAAIKSTSKLVGNELMAFPLDSSAIRPLVGMGVNTIAMPRPIYSSNYDFITWSAIGFQIKVDFAQKTCASYGTG